MSQPSILDIVVVDMEKMLRRLTEEDVELNTLLNRELGRVGADQGQIEQVILREKLTNILHDGDMLSVIVVHAS